MVPNLASGDSTINTAIPGIGGESYLDLFPGLDDIDTDRLVDYEKRVRGLGHYVNTLERTNAVRSAIEKGFLDGLSAENAFHAIWHAHVGSTSSSMALAFAEGDIQYEEWVNALETNKGRIHGTYGPVRVTDHNAPMLFTLPDGECKEDVISLFFSQAESKLRGEPGVSREAWILALEQETYLHFLHPYLDGNGRAAEDWMVWYQRELLRQQQIRDEKSDGEASQNLSIFSISFSQDDHSILLGTRAYSHSGLRAKHFSGNFDNALDHNIPDYVSDGCRDSYLAQKVTILNRTIEMNAFRREMFASVSGLFPGYGIERDPNLLINAIVGNPKIVTQYFEELFNSDRLLLPASMYGGLDETGDYDYIFFTAGEAVKAGYL